jgi:hypothetical protein
MAALSPPTLPRGDSSSSRRGSQEWVSRASYDFSHLPAAAAEAVCDLVVLDARRRWRVPRELAPVPYACASPVPHACLMMFHQQLCQGSSVYSFAGCSVQVLHRCCTLASQTTSAVLVLRGQAQPGAKASAGRHKGCASASSLTVTHQGKGLLARWCKLDPCPMKSRSHTSRPSTLTVTSR